MAVGSQAAIMLKATDQNIKHCYEKALECEQRAADVRNAGEREFWSDRQRQWLHLAVSYDFRQRLKAFLATLNNWPKQPFCSGCDAPMQAKEHRDRSDGLTQVEYECPKCGTKRTLVEMEGGLAHRQPL